MNMNKRWQDFATLILGGWLMVSPFILQRPMIDNAMFNNSLIVGLFVTLAAAAAIIRPNAWKEWVLVALASWLISSSYFLSPNHVSDEYFSTLALSQLIVGLLILVDAAFGLYRKQAIRDMDNPNKVGRVL